MILQHAPTEDELARLYWELSKVGGTGIGANRPWPYKPNSAEQLLVLASQMMRYDARLLHILVQWLPAHFDTLNPLLLRRELRETRWPQSLLVALEFARLSLADPELEAFAEYVSSGFESVDPAERFFIGYELPGTRWAARNLGRNLAPYARWGFISQERPIVDPVTKRTVGRYDVETRRWILKELAQTKPDFSIADYLVAVDETISRQQALADLQAYAAIEKVGNGRGARWRTKPKAAPRKPRKVRKRK